MFQIMNQMQRVWMTVLVVGMALLLGGCPPPTYTDYEAFLKTPKPIVGGKPYVLEPPDRISIIAPTVPEIDNVNQKLRPDGFVTLYLLGDVFAAGKTPTQLAAEIEEKARKYYEDVNVQVRVDDFVSKVYYMAGETSMGPKQYDGTTTVLDAVLRAGVSRTAWPEYVTVLRPNEQGELIRRMTINFNDMITKGDLKYNAVLEEGDIVFMPINPLAAIGVAVQNLFSPVSPVTRLVGGPATVANIPTSAGY